MVKHAPLYADVDPYILKLAEESFAGLDKAAVQLFGTEFCRIFQSEANVFQFALAPDFNCGVVVASDQASFSVTLMLGLVRFYEEMTRMILSRAEGEDVEFAETVAYARVLFESFWSGQLPPAHLRRRFRLSMKTEPLCFQCVRRGIKFAVAHEFGHILLDLSQGRSASPSLSALRRIARDSALIGADSPRGLSATQRSAFVPAWSDEFAADSIGLALCHEVLAQELVLAPMDKESADFFHDDLQSIYTRRSTYGFAITVNSDADIFDQCGT